VTDHETTVLSYRLQSLADHMTPQLDVVGQVRATGGSGGPASLPSPSPPRPPRWWPAR
jgi:hypothetical protein